MGRYILDDSSISHLQSLCGLTHLVMYTTSISTTWGKSALAPSVSISDRKNAWIVIRGELGNSPRLKRNYEFELDFITVSKHSAPESVQYIRDEYGHRMMDRNLSSIDFEQPYELQRISIVNFIDEIDDSVTISYDGALIFFFVDGRRFSLTAGGALLNITTDAEYIDWLLSKQSVTKSITK